MSKTTLEYAGHQGEEVRATLFHPPEPSESTPALVLVHGVFGLDAHMQAVAGRLAEAGLRVLAPDLYSREGSPDAGASPERTADLPDRRVLADLEAGLCLLGELDGADPERLGAIGFGMGGTYAFLLACTSRRLACAVDFYGKVLYGELSAKKPIQPLELALNLSCPLMAHFGEGDASIPAEHVERLKGTLDQFAKSAEIHVHRAEHGFFNEPRAGYDATAQAASWDLTLDFLHAHLTEFP